MAQLRMANRPWLVKNEAQRMALKCVFDVKNHVIPGFLEVTIAISSRCIKITPMPNAQSWGHREWTTPMNLSGRNWAVTIESGQIIWSNEFAKKND